MRKRVFITVLSAGLLLIGAAFLISAAYIPAKAALAQVLLERAWARAQGGEGDARPWRWADMAPVAEIAVPRLGTREIVLEGVSGQAMAFKHDLARSEPRHCNIGDGRH